MTANPTMPFRNGQSVTITRAPPELLLGLPQSDQEAITACIGKPGVFVGIDEYGYAELEFIEDPNDYRTIFVSPTVVEPFGPRSGDGDAQ